MPTPRADSVAGPSRAVEARIAAALSALTRDALKNGADAEPYARRYLPEHVAAGYAWDELNDLELLDALDPGVIAAEAWRTGVGTRVDQHPALAVTLVAHDQLARESDPGSRHLIRELAAARMGARLGDTQVSWAQLARVTPHIVLSGHTSGVTAVTFDTLPDGTPILATGSHDRTVRLWNPTTGTPIGEALTDRTSIVESIALSTLPDGTPILATGSNDNTLRLWNPTTGTPVREPLTGHTGTVRSVAFSTLPDGTPILATGSNDSTVRLWNPTTGIPVSEPLTGHTSVVESVTFGTLSDDTHILATGSCDSTVRLWNPTTGAQIGEPLTGHTNSVRSVAFGIAPKGTPLLASCSRDGTVRFWDPTSSQIQGHLTVTPSSPQDMCITEGHLYIACSDGPICLSLEQVLAHN